MTIHIIKKVSELSTDNSLFCFEGFSGVAAANATTNIDFKFTNERWLTGGILYANNANWGDTGSIQIVDKDNILGYGADLVLREFVKNMVMRTDQELQQELQITYVSLIKANLYLRLKYTNTNLTTAVNVGCNLFTHIPTA